jgi:hypothetical protein
VIIQERLGFRVSCIEEPALSMGYSDEERLLVLTRDMLKNESDRYLLNALAETASPSNE